MARNLILTHPPALNALPLPHIVEYREGFNLFDRKGNGTIGAESLGDLLRALGQNPTQTEVEQLTAQADPTGSRSIAFDTFLKILLRPDGFRPAGTYDEFVNGFKVFDKDGDGFISSGELRFGKSRDFFFFFLVG